MIKAQSTLYEFYNNLFEGVVASTDEERHECFRIRHQVYCFEIKTENPNDDGIERDEHDDHAIHALLRHRPSQNFIGTVRLVPQRSEAHARTTPVPTLCAQHGLSLPPDYKPETTAEISRFAISKMFRRRILDTVYSSAYTRADLESDRARFIPCMALGLMMLSNQMAQRNNIDRYCAVMEPALLRMLGKLGMHFHPIGPLVEYHGKRQICCATIDEMRKTITLERPDVLEVLTDRGQFP